MEILNLSKKPATETKIFFGEYSGFQRYDVYKYPFAKNIEEKMRQAFWNPNEVSLASDRLKFPELPKYVQDILTQNILYQTSMDSGQNRGLDGVLATLATSPEWEAVFKTQGYFELIHSLSYSHILREIYPDPTHIFDSIYDNAHIKARMNKEIEAYSNAHKDKKSLLELILRIYALEGLKFYVSFLVTFTINNTYHGAIQGITRIIKLIAFDENLHVAVMSGLLNTLRKNKDEGFAELINSKWFAERATAIFKETAEDEIVWGEYLLSFGQLNGLTSQIIKEFCQYFVDDRLKRVGIEPIYNQKTNDVVEWFKNYQDITLDNTAQQESTSLSYRIGTLKNDLKEGEKLW